MLDTFDSDSLSEKDIEALKWLNNHPDHLDLLMEAIDEVSQSTGMGEAKIKSVLLESEPTGEVENIDRHFLDAIHRLRQKHNE